MPHISDKDSKGSLEGTECLPFIEDEITRDHLAIAKEYAIGVQKRTRRWGRHRSDRTVEAESKPHDQLLDVVEKWLIGIKFFIRQL